MHNVLYVGNLFVKQSIDHYMAYVIKSFDVRRCLGCDIVATLLWQVCAWVCERIKETDTMETQ